MTNYDKRAGRKRDVFYGRPLIISQNELEVFLFLLLLF